MSKLVPSSETLGVAQARLEAARATDPGAAARLIVAFVTQRQNRRRVPVKEPQRILLISNPASSSGKLTLPGLPIETDDTLLAAHDKLVASLQIRRLHVVDKIHGLYDKKRQGTLQSSDPPSALFPTCSVVTRELRWERNDLLALADAHWAELSNGEAERLLDNGHPDAAVNLQILGYLSLVPVTELFWNSARIDRPNA
nr:MetaGeneMark_Unknown Function [uncultured bacterium]